MAARVCQKLSGFTILFLHGRDVAPFRREAGLVAEDFDRIEDGLVSRLGAASVFLAGVHMIPGERRRDTSVTKDERCCAKPFFFIFCPLTPIRSHSHLGVHAWLVPTVVAAPAVPARPRAPRVH